MIWGIWYSKIEIFYTYLITLLTNYSKKEFCMSSLLQLNEYLELSYTQVKIIKSLSYKFKAMGLNQHFRLSDSHIQNKYWYLTTFKHVNCTKHERIIEIGNVSVISSTRYGLKCPQPQLIVISVRYLFHNEPWLYVFTVIDYSSYIIKFVSLFSH